MLQRGYLERYHDSNVSYKGDTSPFYAQSAELFIEQSNDDECDQALAISKSSLPALVYKYSL